MDDGSPAVSPARRTRKAALMTRGGDVDHRSLLQASLALDTKEREMVGSTKRRRVDVEGCRLMKEG